LSGILSNFVKFIEAYGVVGLAVISFAESSFFPIPPDILLIPMAFMNRKLALFYALITTVSSVLGGAFGYIIGNKLGKPILRRFFKEEKIKKVEGYFAKYGGWAIIIAGFTPIPYKLFTISAGAFGVRMYTLIMASIFGRGGRFFLEGFFIFFLGDKAKYYLQNYFEVFTIGITVFGVIFYYVWKKLKMAGKIKGTGVMAKFKKKYEKLNALVLRYRKYDRAATYFFISIFAALFSLLVFLEFVEDYLTRGNWNFDIKVINYINTIRSTTLNQIFKTITITGSTLFIMVITLVLAVILIRKQQKKEAFLLSFNTVGLCLFNMALKQVFRRPRPLGLRIIKVSGYSFPSGHAMTFMGFSILIIYYLLTGVRKKRPAILASVLIFIYAIFVGISRVYLGVHFLSDVFAGWFAGILWSSTSIVIYKALGYRRSLELEEV
jgi:undecaprenyl-diphosphatase